LSVLKYYTPEEFTQLKEIALSKGFRYCGSGPLVQSCYHEDEQVNASAKRKHQMNDKGIVTF